MAELFTIANLMTLCMLTVLQAVLGFDNLLYISIESKRVREEKQRFVRQVGVGLAIVLRILLLLVVMSAIEHLKEPFFKIHLFGVFEGEFNVHSLITLVGGGFIHLFGFVVEPMAKSTFYFVLAVLVVIDVVQSRYQKKLLAQRHAEMH